MLAVGLATPAFAQQTGISDAQTSLQLRQQSQQFAQQLQDAINRKDAQAAANLFSRDGFLSTRGGTATGRLQIEQVLQDQFRQTPSLIARLNVERVQSIGTGGDAAWSEGTWTGTSAETLPPGESLEAQGPRERGAVTSAQEREGIESGPSASGYWLSVINREGGEWKIRVLMSNLTTVSTQTFTGTSAPPVPVTPRNRE
jgi:uncharacterized protein (TIGR02246 family)